MPLPSNVRITEEQETALKTYISDRLRSLRADNEERIEADKMSWLRYRNDRSDRTGGVWDHENTPLPLTSLVCDYFISRAHDDILGEKPFFSTRPQGPGDRDLARKIQRFAQYRLVDVGKLSDEIDLALSGSFIQRASILKSIYYEEKDSFERMGMMALHDRQTGDPVEILGKGFILEDAEWIEQPDPLSPSLDPTGAPATRVHLKDDPSFILDETKHEFRKLDRPVVIERTLYSGPRSVEVESHLFLAPTNARSLAEADFIAECYDKTGQWVLDRFTERKWLSAKDYEAKIEGEDATHKTAAKKDSSYDDDDEKPEDLTFDPRTKRIGLVEVWLNWDIRDDGKIVRLAAWYDEERDVLTSYDYQAIYSPTGRHPFSAIAVAKHKHRWWGYSLPELIAFCQDYIDLQFNRHSFRNSINANPLIGQNPDAIKEKIGFLEVKPFGVVTLEDGKQMQDWLQAFVFPNADLDTQLLIDKVIYFIQLWLGISNVSQGDYSDVPQNTTAFGQDATLRESAKLSRRYTRHCKSGFGDHITNLVKLLLATMDPEEVFYYTEGDETLADVLNADAVRSLEIDVVMVVGRPQNSQAIQATTLAEQIVEKYLIYLQTEPWKAKVVRELNKHSLRLLGFDDVDTLLPDPDRAAELGIPPPVGPSSGFVPESGKDRSATANTAASVISPPTTPNMNEPKPKGVSGG